MGDFQMFVNIGKYCGMFINDVICMYGGKINGVRYMFIGVVFMIVDCVIFQIFIKGVGDCFFYCQCGV